MLKTIKEIIDTACKQLRYELKGCDYKTLSNPKHKTPDGNNIIDIIGEIADSNVPNCSDSLLKLAEENLQLALEEPETRHREYKNNAIGKLQATVFERIAKELFLELERIKEKMKHRHKHDKD